MYQESEKLELKESLNEWREIIISLSAFANKNGGKIVVGLSDKAEPKGLEIGKSNAHQEKIGKVTLQTIEIEQTFPGFGFFPKPGRAVSLIHDNYQHEKKVTSLVTAGLMNTAITLRATDEANFSVHELINFLNKKVPGAFTNGGGHKNAGSINFLPYKKEEIVSLLKEFIKNR